MYLLTTTQVICIPFQTKPFLCWCDIKSGSNLCLHRLTPCAISGRAQHSRTIVRTGTPTPCIPMILCAHLYIPGDFYNPRFSDSPTQILPITSEDKPQGRISTHILKLCIRILTGPTLTLWIKARHLTPNWKRRRYLSSSGQKTTSLGYNKEWKDQQRGWMRIFSESWGRHLKGQLVCREAARSPVLSHSNETLIIQCATPIFSANWVC